MRKLPKVGVQQHCNKKSNRGMRRSTGVLHRQSGELTSYSYPANMCRCPWLGIVPIPPLTMFLLSAVYSDKHARIIIYETQ